MIYICVMEDKNFILNRIVDVVDRTEPNAEVYLYGSRAKGTAKKISDWDILILLNIPVVSFDYETKFLDSLYEIEIETGEIISPLIYAKNEWLSRHYSTPLFTNIQNEGIKIK